MKKIIFYTTIILTALGLQSCDKFLDVNPRQNVKQDVLFSTEDGYKSAVNGIYIRMATSTLYGRNMTMYTPELLMRSWILPLDVTSTMYRLSNWDFDYKEIDDHINSIWLNYYNCIVQINNILGALENPVPQFQYNNDKFIEGEALGLRAFLHLDVLRFWGPSPTNVSGSDRAIPYVTEFTKDPNKLLSKTWSEVIREIENDLNKAEALLKDIDPIITWSNAYLNSPGSGAVGDDWHYYRQNRFNYYAVLATKARFYNWIGDKAKAAEYAEMVINNGGARFPLTREPDVIASSTSNLIFYSENIFAVHNPNHQSIIQNLFRGVNATLYQTRARVNELYEGGISSMDVRRIDRYWKETTYPNSVIINHFLKFTGSDNINTKNMVPLIRMAEMYLILVENTPLEEANTWFNLLRNARSMDASLDNSLTDDLARDSRLEKEYRKEFFGEGQFFFYAKKRGITVITWPSRFELPDGVESYKLPRPKSQTDFE